MAGSWIFQGNPKLYDVEGAVRALPRIEWRVRQYKRQIEAGDGAYIWETGGTGFVARAVVSGEPAVGYDDDEEDPFRRSARDLGPKLYAPLTISEVFDPPILACRLPCRSHPEDARQSGVPERHQLPRHARTGGHNQRRAGRTYEVAPRTAVPTDGGVRALARSYWLGESLRGRVRGLAALALG